MVDELDAAGVPEPPFQRLVRDEAHLLGVSVEDFARAALERHIAWSRVQRSRRGEAVSNPTAESARDQGIGGLRSAEVFADIARQLHAQASPEQTWQMITELAVNVLDEFEHAGISILRRGGRIDTPASNDGVPRHIDELQYATGEGPILSTIGDEGMVVSGDLRTETRWPSFCARAVAETGVLSMLSFQLFVGEQTLGALSFTSSQPDAFDETAYALGSIFASHAALAMMSAGERSTRAWEIDQLVRISSHDLQAPLREVSGFGYLLRTSLVPGQLSERQTAALDAMISGADRMQTMIRDQLDYVRAGNLSASTETVNVTDVMADVEQRLHPALSAAHAVLRATVDSGLHVIADRGQLTRAVENIIDNCLTNRRADRDPEIDITAAAEGDAVVVVITDNGAGIQAIGYDEAMTKPFKRATAASTGVGLPLATRIIEAQGGSIDIRSDPATGTAIHLRLPARTPQTR